MQIQTILAIFVAGWLPASAAKADFRLRGAASGPQATIFSDQAISPTVSDAVSPPAEAVDTASTERPGTPIARGFGHSVQLSFAARQIVPRNVAIRYAPDVDQTIAVDWTGDRPWTIILAAAVKPLGLHLTFSRTSVLIS